MREPRRLSRRLLVLLLTPILLTSLASAQPSGAEDPIIDAGTALLIVDIQAFYFPGGALPLVEPEPAAANAGKLLQYFRDEGRLVVHIGHNVGQGGDFHTAVMPAEGEKVIYKDQVSAFNGTELAAFLSEHEIKKLIIVGMQTHMCLEGAVRAAYDLGFEVVVAHDACATRDLKYSETTVAAQDIHLSTLATLRGAYAQVIDTESLLAPR